MTDPEDPEAARRAQDRADARAVAEAKARLIGEHAKETAAEQRRFRWLRRLAELVLDLLR